MDRSNSGGVKLNGNETGRYNPPTTSIDIGNNREFKYYYIIKNQFKRK